jgi:hypothetical protein
MKIRYVVKGTQQIGDDKVRLTIMEENLVKEKDPSAMSMLKDMSGTIQKMQSQAMISTNPDVITIPMDLWAKHQYKIGDVINIEIMEK